MLCVCICVYQFIHMCLKMCMHLYRMGGFTYHAAVSSITASHPSPTSQCFCLHNIILLRVTISLLIIVTILVISAITNFISFCLFNIVEFDKPEANPKNNLMMRRADLSTLSLSCHHLQRFHHFDHSNRHLVKTPYITCHYLCHRRISHHHNQ